ncbi:MAG: ribonuclease HII [Caldisericia bacterium]
MCACKLFQPIEDVNDSKKISEKKRVFLANRILDCSVVSLTVIPNDLIDKNGIFGSVMCGMKKVALDIYSDYPGDSILIDGPHIPEDMPFCTEPVIKGDSKFQAIAAASIVAKVVRDYIMYTYSKIYREYGFEKNKGYGTAEHYRAIKENALSKIHRRSFRIC